MTDELAKPLTDLSPNCQSCLLCPQKGQVKQKLWKGWITSVKYSTSLPNRHINTFATDVIHQMIAKLVYHLRPAITKLLSTHWRFQYTNTGTSAIAALQQNSLQYPLYTTPSYSIVLASGWRNRKLCFDRELKTPKLTVVQWEMLTST